MAGVPPASSHRRAYWTLGCGIGGPARYRSATFGCNVLASTSALPSSMLRHIGPRHVPDRSCPRFAFRERASVFLQHVAMNIEDRSLYADLSELTEPEREKAIGRGSF
jgi:hypothetical protein